VPGFGAVLSTRHLALRLMIVNQLDPALRSRFVLHRAKTAAGLGREHRLYFLGLWVRRYVERFDSVDAVSENLPGNVRYYSSLYLKTVAILRQGGHEVLAASPNSGVNTITGEGLKEALAGAQVVIETDR
jgi:hypothetical protein